MKNFKKYYKLLFKLFFLILAILPVLAFLYPGLPVTHDGQDHVARIANGFEMNVLAFDVREDKKLAKKFNFKYAGFEDLLSGSDIITLHVPYNEKTRHLISLQNINLICI